MSEHLLKILLGELDTVRIACQGATCRAIIETPLERLPLLFAGFACPVCRAPFRAAGQDGPNHLQQLHEALVGLKSLQHTVQVQFVLPVTE